MTIDPRRVQAGLDPVGPLQPKPADRKPDATRSTPGDFERALSGARKPEAAPPDVTLSAHAAQRLMQRGITLDRGDLEKISQGMDRAAEKGAKESLFVLRDLALIVSVENRTVITALHGEAARENVYTQIDSALLL